MNEPLDGIFGDIPRLTSVKLSADVTCNMTRPRNVRQSTSTDLTVAQETTTTFRHFRLSCPTCATVHRHCTVHIACFLAATLSCLIRAVLFPISIEFRLTLVTIYPSDRIWVDHLFLNLVFSQFLLRRCALD